MESLLVRDIVAGARATGEMDDQGQQSEGNQG